MPMIEEKRIILTNKGRDFLRNLRRKKGLPKLFIKNYPTIVKWENGINNPTFTIFSQYLDSFDLNINYLEKRGFLRKIVPSIRELAIKITTKIGKEKHKLLIHDYHKGLSLEEIGKKYGCTASNVFYILKRYGVDTAKHGSGEKYSFPESDYIKYLIRSKINKEEMLPLISSLLLTDGGLYKDKKGYAIVYYGTDVTLHNIFADLIWCYFKLRPGSYMTKCGRVLRTKYINKDIASELLKLSPSYKTKPYFKEGWKNFLSKSKQPTLSFMKKYNNFIIKEAIRLAMCADGCISISNRRDRGTIMFTLMLACAHPTLVKEWSKLFKRIGIQNSIVKGTAKTKIGGVKGVKDCIFQFSNIGGFIDGIKVCVRHSPLYGIEKQSILSKAADFLKRYNNVNSLQISFEKFKKSL